MAAQQPIKVVPNWQDVNLAESLGLDLTDDSESTRDEALLQAVNFVARGDSLEIDNGTAIYNHGVWGTPRAVASVITIGGDPKNFLFTNKAVYEDTVGEWKALADQAAPASTTISGNVSAGALSIPVTSSAGWAPGDVFRLTLDSGKYFTQEIVTITAGPVFNFTTGVTSAATSGNAVVKAYILAGNDVYPFHWVQTPFADHIIFVNYGNHVKTLDINTLTIIDTPDLPAACGAINVTVWDNSVFLFGTVEVGIRYPRRYRYSAAGDDTDWTTVGDAGYGDLYDSTEAILSGKQIGPYMAVYRTNSIVRFEPTGDATRRFDTPTVVTGTGLIGTRAIMSIDNNTHIGMSRENVFIYSGGFTTTPVGDPIVKRLFGRNGTLDLAKGNRVSMVYDKDDKKVCIFYPTSSSTDGFGDKCLIYNLTKGKWTERIFGFTVSGGGELIQNGTFVTYPGAEASYKRIIILLDSVNDTTYEYSNNYTTDSGSNMGSILETKDFSLADMKLELDRVCVVLYAPSQATLYYSIDRGANYVSMGTFAPATMQHQRFFKQIVFDTIRFKLSSLGLIKVAGFSFKTKIAAEF
jgi:hypothetical protein